MLISFPEKNDVCLYCQTQIVYCKADWCGAVKVVKQKLGNGEGEGEKEAISQTAQQTKPWKSEVRRAIDTRITTPLVHKPLVNVDVIQNSAHAGEISQLYIELAPFWRSSLLGYNTFKSQGCVHLVSNKG